MSLRMAIDRRGRVLSASARCARVATLTRAALGYARHLEILRERSRRLRQSAPGGDAYPIVALGALHGAHNFRDIILCDGGVFAAL